MKTDFTALDRFRIQSGDYRSPLGESFGMFRIPTRAVVLTVISSGSFHDTVKWEHVSISTSSRCPTWEEMDLVKDMFWTEFETVIQLHVPKTSHINKHPYCLHLWKYIEDQPLPPTEYVG